MDYSPWFDFWESKKGLEKRIPPERASQEEQNGTNFTFIAPSCDELWLPTHMFMVKVVTVVDI